MRSLINIQSAFSHVRTFMILTLGSQFLILCFAFFCSWQFKEEQKRKIYALQGEEPLNFIFNQSTTDNRMAEAKANVERFHELFFNLYPDKSMIVHKVQRALEMADNSAYDLYKSLMDSGFYRQLEEAKIFCLYKCDSVCVDVSTYPYKAVMYGKMEIERTSGSTFRNLVTQCNIRNCARSEATPHGFMIENLEVIDNKDLLIDKLY